MFGRGMQSQISDVDASDRRTLAAPREGHAKCRVARLDGQGDHIFGCSCARCAAGAGDPSVATSFALSPLGTSRFIVGRVLRGFTGSRDSLSSVKSRRPPNWRQ